MEDFKFIGSALFKTLIVIFSIIILLFLLFFPLQGISMVARITGANIDRVVFRESIAYTEAAATFLADASHEYALAETETEKEAIRQYVYNRYPNLDTSTIDNPLLKEFYEECLTGE